MKPSLTFTASDIRAALLKVLDEKYSNIYNPAMEAPMITLAGEGDNTQAVLTFRDRSFGSAWD